MNVNIEFNVFSEKLKMLLRCLYR